MKVSTNPGFLFVCIFALLSLISCSDGSYRGQASGKEVSGILVVSDSMGTGYQIATPYPDRISLLTGIKVINNSIDGRQTGEVVGLLEGLLDEHKPSHLVLLMGTNDARKNQQTEAVANLGKMSELALHRQIEVVIGTIPVYMPSQQIDQRARLISESIKTLQGIRVADIRTALGDGTDTLGDGIHPNDAGQQLMAELFIKQL